MAHNYPLVTPAPLGDPQQAHCRTHLCLEPVELLSQQLLLLLICRLEPGVAVVQQPRPARQRHLLAPPTGNPTDAARARPQSLSATTSIVSHKRQPHTRQTCRSHTFTCMTCRSHTFTRRTCCFDSPAMTCHTASSSQGSCCSLGPDTHTVACNHHTPPCSMLQPPSHVSHTQGPRESCHRAAPQSHRLPAHTRDLFLLRAKIHAPTHTWGHMRALHPAMHAKHHTFGAALYQTGHFEGRRH